MPASSSSRPKREGPQPCAVAQACALLCVALSAATPLPLLAQTPPAAPDDTPTLDTITVTATGAPNPTTGGKPGSAARATSVGKDAQKLKDIPQSVIVITRQQLDDQGTTTLEGAMKNVTDVTVQRFDAAGLNQQLLRRPTQCHADFAGNPVVRSAFSSRLPARGSIEAQIERASTLHDTCRCRHHLRST